MPGKYNYFYFAQAIWILKNHIWFMGGVENIPFRYYDFFFSSVGLLCGGILFFQGWRLDPILLLSQILLGGSTIFFMAESLYLRNDSNYGKNTETMNIDSKFQVKQRCFKNFFSINRKEWDKIGPTKHISHSKKKGGRH